MKDLMLLTKEEWDRNEKTHKWFKYIDEAGALNIKCSSCGWKKIFNGFSHITPDCNEYKMDQALE